MPKKKRRDKSSDAFCFCGASVLLYDDHIVWQVALQHALISANKSKVLKCITNLNEASCVCYSGEVGFLKQQRTFLICFFPLLFPIAVPSRKPFAAYAEQKHSDDK